ncbi:hypothetical protein B0H34DRAFT_691774 [Crassisporium funariophilum]|nr:hypothetical protein B0H34DRAFT_691774 [Crassisporium funariophilum]
MPSCLPAELVEHIVYEVGHLPSTNPEGERTRISTLKSCALVSFAFLFPSQRLLFHTIDLDSFWRHLTRKKCSLRFHRLLSSSPHVGTYVRELRLGDDVEDDYSANAGTNRSWLPQATHIPSMLQMMPNLTAFSLTFNGDVIQWKSLSAEIRSALGRLFRLPTLQAVTLEFITGFPPQLLYSLARLKCLGLSCVDVDTSTPFKCEDQTHLRSHSKSQLEALYLRGTLQPTILALTAALSSASPVSLRKLLVTPTVEPGFCTEIAQLLLTIGSGISHFGWLPSIHFSPSSDPINISSTTLPHLHTLRFTVSFRQMRSRGGPFHKIHGLLGQLLSDTDATATNNIKSITFDVNFLQVASDEKSIRSTWRPIEILLEHPGFARLQEIKIRLPTSTNGVQARGMFGLAFEYFFVGLRGRGVKVTMEVLHGRDERFLVQDCFL